VKVKNISRLQRIMHAVLTGRMLLYLREYEHRNVHGDGLVDSGGVPMSLEFRQNASTTAADG
jgi:hypothetical protein